MTHDQIDRLARQANPVPDLSVLEPLDASQFVPPKQRTTDMRTDQVVIDRQPDRRRYGVLIGIAATVAIVIGILVLIRLTDGVPAAGGGRAPQSVAAAAGTAEAFLEAFRNFDADTAASHLDENVLESEFGGLEGLRLEIANWKDMGFKLLLGTCEASAVTPDRVAVRCPYDYHAIRSDEMGLGPYTGSTWVFTVLDRKIVSAINGIRFLENGFSAQVWGPFAAWLAETYPQDAETMYTDATRTQQLASEESNRLWELRSREYVVVVSGQTERETARVSRASHSHRRRRARLKPGSWSS